MLERVFEQKTGAILVSILLGLGLAAMFRRSCSGSSCVVVKSPDLKAIEGNVYKVNNDCYKYSPEIVPCERDDKPTPTSTPLST